MQPSNLMDCTSLSPLKMQLLLHTSLCEIEVEEKFLRQGNLTYVSAASLADIQTNQRKYQEKPHSYKVAQKP